MKLAKAQHEMFAQFFEQPTREKLRDLLKQSIGETDYLDFKAEWPDLSKVSKHILALANSGGGALVLGLRQTDDGVIETIGLTEFTDKADVSKTVKRFLPKNVQYEVFDFFYTESEYQVLKGKKFQVVLVEYSEKLLPLLSLKEGDGVRANVAYVRDGTESVEANHEQLEHLINLRIESGYTSTHTLDLREHLDQLRALYKASRAENSWGILSTATIESFLSSPMTEYYKCIEDMISSKKLRIQKELDK